MNRIHRSSSPRVIRLISLALCYVLVVTMVFVPLGPSAVGAGRDGNAPAGSRSSRFMQPAGILGTPGRLLASLITFLQGGGPPSVPGPNLPDLDVVRQVQSSEPDALPPIASSQPNPEICDECEPGNHPPLSRPGGPYFGSANQLIAFNGLGSRDVDPGDGISEYAWTFGDGPTIVYGATPSHTYQSSGVFTVTLKVTDYHDAWQTASTTVTVNPGATPTPTPAASPTPNQANAATFVAQSVPPTMTAGQQYPVSVTMRNTGAAIWSAAHLYRLGPQNPQNNTSWGKTRVYLPSDVLPGAEITFNFTVRAPYGAQLGQAPVHFQWQMVQDGVEWFGQTQDVVVTVTTPGQISSLELQPENLATARLDAKNRTGEPGEDLVSGNFNWMLNVLSLSGRSGLNLNLPLSYNSLAAWTKLEGERSSITFDADRGSPSVGFRLGFPSLVGPFANNQTGKNAYLLTTPAGGHIELRQVASTSVYESADSSYLELLEGGNGTLLLRVPDGSQLAYLKINGEYRCTEIKDRNGNYITIKYDLINGTANPGSISSIIDTLGRTINFNYDGNLRLLSITQLRGGQPHAWVTFGYSDLEVRTNFVEEVDPYGEASATPSEIEVIGLRESNTVSVLTQVSLDDGSRFNFEYTSWGQIYKITRHAADSTLGSSHLLSYVSYDLPLDNDDPKNDCPRFTQREDWVENWNGNVPVPTNFQFDEEGQWGQVTAPNGTFYKEFFTTDYNDWRRGLVTRTELYAPGDAVPEKTTITDWTQDDINIAYPLNPRAMGVTVSDSSGNRSRTTIEHAAFGLPSDAFEWGPSGTNDWTLLRRTHTDYEFSQIYLSRHIIGLVKQQFLFGAEDNGQRLYSKITYEYDAAGEFLVDQGNPVQHDDAHGLGLVQGRGNVTTVRRWDVNHETDITKSTASRVGYNTTGSAIFGRDALNHQSTISYNDSFSPNGISTTGLSFATLAYATTVTDSDGYSSSAKYNYDLGLVTRQQDPKGAALTTEYDSAGRVKRITNAINGAYARFVYPPSLTIVNKFTTIKDLTTETYTAAVFDGGGRVRAVARDFPGSAGHYSGQFTLYNQQSRAVQSTNPTEMTNTWAAAGDDAIGWHSSWQTYDWKGRQLKTTNTDGTTREASYGGCGCAGGGVVTATDEGTIEGGVPKRRQQKIYSDSLGRAVKTEVLNWEGGSVYSATVNTYNARDQVINIRRYQGPDTSGVYQDQVSSYDGYGRLKTSHAPEQNANTATTYDYNSDDTVEKVTDARGASQTFSYNNRHLVTGINYFAPSGVTPTAPVTYDYDGAGNRISMTDGLGSVSYHFDQLSRMDWEERNFASTTLPPHRLTYSYNLATELASITDSFGSQVGYERDAAGNTTSVTGAGFANISTYASNFQYRASGQLKGMTYGNGRTLSMNFNNRLQVSRYEVSGVVKLDYQYQADGRLEFADDLLDSKFDRSFGHDHVGRLTSALSGAEARGEPATNDRPYKQTYAFDPWGNMTSRTGKHWSHNTTSFSGVYFNNRVDGWQYDADGRNTQSNSVTSTFDAAGRLIQTLSPQRRNNPPLVLTQEFDGDGQRVKKTEYGTTTFLLRSTVLAGAVIAEIYGSAGQSNFGQKQKGHVYAQGMELAEQNTFVNAAFYKHLDPSGSEDGTSYIHPDGSVLWGRTQLDPLGDDVGEEDPYEFEPGGGDMQGFYYPTFGDVTDNPFGCTVDGMPWPCSIAFKYAAVRSTIITKNDYAWITVRNRRVEQPRPPENIGFVAGGSVRFSPSGDGGYYEWKSDKDAIDWGALEAALKTCIHKLYPWFEMGDFKPTDSGGEGGKKDDDKHNGVIEITDSDLGRDFNVVNDPTPPKEIKADIKRNHARGSTDLLNPFWTYACPECDSNPRPGDVRYPELYTAITMNSVRVQIHELGAALSRIRDIYHPGPWAPLPDGGLDPGHGDDGPAMEDCVGREYYKQVGLQPH